MLSTKELMLSNCGAGEDSWETLESPLDCKEIKPVNPKGNQPSIFFGRTDADLKFQYFGHLMWWADSLEKTLMLEKIEGRRREQQSMRWLDSITDSMDMNLSTLWDIVEDRRAWSATVHGGQKELDMTLVTKQQQLETLWTNCYFYLLYADM